MKKIFYIVLVIFALLIIGQFVKQETATPIQEEVVVVEEGTIANDVIGDGEVVEEEAEEVVETNPEATADEDETVVEEDNGTEGETVVEGKAVVVEKAAQKQPFSIVFFSKVLIYIADLKVKRTRAGRKNSLNVFRERLDSGIYRVISRCGKTERTQIVREDTSDLRKCL